MAFFKRKTSMRPNALVNVKDVYVVKTTITLSHNDGTGCGPRCVTWYFLAKLENNEYYELFAGKKLEKDGVFVEFDTPYIEKVKPLSEYLSDRNKKKMELQLLFDFITNKNAINSLGALKDGNKDEN